MPTGLSGTPDGRRIVAVLKKSRQPDVYVADTAGDPVQLTNVRRLTFNTLTDFPHSWSADNQTVLFESDRNGDWQIFGQRLGDNDGEALARGSKWDVMPQASPDGKWILYLHNPRFLPPIGAQASKRVWTLMRIPLPAAGRNRSREARPPKNFKCAAPGGSRCVLRTDENGRFVFYDLDPIRDKGRELTRIPAPRGIFGDWSVSPDGRFAAIPDHDSFPPKFRIVDLDYPEHRETELAIDGIPTVSKFVMWTSKGAAAGCGRPPAQPGRSHPPMAATWLSSMARSIAMFGWWTVDWQILPPLLSH